MSCINSSVVVHWNYIDKSDHRQEKHPQLFLTCNKQPMMNVKLSRQSDTSTILNNLNLSLSASLCRPLSLPVGLTWPPCVSVGPERQGEKGQENFSGSSHTSSQQQSNFNQFACPVHSHYALWHRKIKYLSFSSVCWTPGNDSPCRSRSERGHHKALSLLTFPSPQTPWSIKLHAVHISGITQDMCGSLCRCVFVCERKRLLNKSADSLNVMALHRLFGTMALLVCVRYLLEAGMYLEHWVPSQAQYGSLARQHSAQPCP